MSKRAFKISVPDLDDDDDDLDLDDDDKENMDDSRQESYADDDEQLIDGEGERDGDDVVDREFGTQRYNNDIHQNDDDLDDDDQVLNGDRHYQEDENYVDDSEYDLNDAGDAEDVGRDQWDDEASIDSPPRLHQQLGLEPRPFQIMKSSLFPSKPLLLPTERESTPLRNRSFAVDPFTPNPAAAKSILNRESQLASLSLSPFTRAPVFDIIPHKESALRGRETAYSADAALWQGRAFKAGFTFNSQFYHAGLPRATPTLHHTLRTVDTIWRENAYAKPSPVSTQFYAEYLEQHRKNSQISTTPRPYGAPVWEIINADDLIKACVQLSEAHHKRLAINVSPLTTSITHTHHIWGLVDALWGQPATGLMKWRKESEDNEDVKIKEEYQSELYEEQVARRGLVSQWLHNALKDEIKDQLHESASSSPTYYLHQIFLLLSGLQLNDAVKLAIKHKDYRLATIISQALNTAMRKDLANQVEAWKTLDTPISPERLRIYKMMAASLCREVLEGLDWKQIFGIVMWYGSEDVFDQPILAQSLHAYDDIVSRGNAVHPHPPYANASDDANQTQNRQQRAKSTKRASAYKQKEPEDDSDDDNDDEEDSESTGKPKDTLYHLLRYFADQTYGIAKVVDGSGHTSDVLDKHVSWLLCSALGSVRPGATEKCFESVTYAYSAQLQSVGLWQWAIYVLLHLPVSSTSDSREGLIKDILQRNISIKDDPATREIDAFLMETLKVPSYWIYQAKAWKAGYEHNDNLTLKFLTADTTPSMNWDQAHRLTVDKIAPALMAQGKEAQVENIISNISKYVNDAHIRGWVDGGHLYHEYLLLKRDVPLCVRALGSNMRDPVEQDRLLSLMKRTEDLPSRLSKLVLPHATTQMKQLQQVSVIHMSDELMRMAVSLRRCIAQIQGHADGKREVLEMVGVVSDAPLIPSALRFDLLETMTTAYLESF